MKKIFYLLTILVSVSMQAQIELTPLEVCDIGNDGYEGVMLGEKVSEIFNGSFPQNYTLNFYETYADAQNNQNWIPDALGTYYYSMVPPPYTIYARSENIENGTVELYSFEVIFLNMPEVGLPISLVNSEGIFDLTENIPLISNGNNYNITFFLTHEDAQYSGTPILNPESYTAISSLQPIYVKVESSNGCFIITSFVLVTGDNDDIVNGHDIVDIPDPAFKNKLLQTDPMVGNAFDYNGDLIFLDSNDDGEIQVSEALSIYWLSVQNANIQDMTGIEAFVNLTFLRCRNNQITELNTSSLVNLTILECQNNNLTELDLSNNPDLSFLNCNNNNITELDLSNNPNLETLWAINNPQLTHLNIKNGGNLNPNAVDSGSWTEMWMNLPNNIYICADDDEIALIQPHLNTWNTGQIVVSYCSFEPEGDYNTITGSVLYDFNDNGCDENDVIRYTKININDGTESGASFTNLEGNYLFFTQAGEFILTPELENPTFFNVTPVTETVVFSDNNNNEEVINFCISPNGEYNDLEVVIAPINPARPGFEATYKIVYRNKGNQVISQDYGLNFMYNQNLMTFVSASVEPDSQGPGGLNWGYENLMPFESRSIVVTMQINPPTHPTYPVNIDNVLTFTSLILPSDGDENTDDNLYVLNQTVVGSYDPNDITCIEGDIVDPEYIGEELHYLIRFENTGNYYAENVVIAMEIDEELYDISSLRVLDASHDVRAQVRGNIAEFFFNQIMLDSGGHGNILLVMKSMTALEEGDAVQSKADIYFDYNYPIITNDAVTLFQEELSRDNHELAALISIYPNPATDRVTISSETKIKSVEWYDLSGRLIRISLVNDFQSIQDISSQSEGIYIMKIQTEKGILYQKIIKK